MQKKKSTLTFPYLFLALLFLAGCVGENIPTAMPSETRPEVSHDIRIVLQNMDVPFNSLLIKGMNVAAQADDRICLTIYEAAGGTYTSLTATLLAETPGGILVSEGPLPLNAFETPKAMVVVLNDSVASYNLFHTASIGDEGTVQAAVKLASDHMVKKGFYMIIEEPPRRSLDWSSIVGYDYPEAYGLTNGSSTDPWFSASTSEFELDLETNIGLSLWETADKLSREGDNDLVIFTKTEDWLLMILDMVKTIDFSGRNILIIGYSRDYIFTEKTYTAMRENPDLFILTIYEATGDAQTILLSSLILEAPDGILVFSENTEKIDPVLVSLDTQNAKF